MSIRRRLVTFIVLIMGLLVVTGGGFHLGRPLVVGAFRQSIEAMDTLNTVRELSFSINRQKTFLNRYLLLDDRREYLSFQEASRQAKKSFDLLKADAYGDFKKDYETLLNNFEKAQAVSADVIADFQSGQKARAHNRWASELNPAYQALTETVERIQNDQSEKSQDLFNKIKRLGEKVDRIIMVVMGLTFLAGIILFRSLYRAVMNPLQIMKQGADKFGKGNLDHRIQLPTKNEFGALADSFNKMADNIRQLQLQAVHMDRMSAVGQLAGGVAHEINNPLTAVLGQTQIMLAKIDPGDPRVEKLKKIENAAIRCRKIVRSLLDFSRPSPSQFEQVNVNSMIANTIDLCEADLKKGRVMVEKNLGVGIPKIKGNTSELQQVLLNLVNNAIQAMPGGGTLTLETVTHNRSIKIAPPGKGTPTETAGPWVEIRVKDTGIGIPKQHISRVFDPFFTTKDIGKGTGLGLSVSTGIIRNHGGEIRVDSHGQNRGSVFTVVLPVRGPAESRIQPSKGKAA